MKLAVIIDPLSQLNPKKDTTLGLLHAAQQKKWPIFSMEINDLFLKNNLPYAYTKELHIENTASSLKASIKKEGVLPLDYFDYILMRKDPPIDKHYLHATYILDFAEKNGVGVLNKPRSLRNYNEKLATLFFSHLCPNTLVTARYEEIKNFLHEHKTIICKPINEMGGTSVFKLEKNDQNSNVILETLTHREKTHIICQRYLPEIKNGDKRIIMINGKPLPYALVRIPQTGEIRANLASGGTGHGAELSPQDKKICEELAPFLIKEKLFLVGLDIIGDYLTEINITSPTCVRELEIIYNEDFSKQIIEALINVNSA